MKRGTWVTVGVVGSALLVSLMLMPGALARANDPYWTGRWSTGSAIALALMWIGPLAAILGWAVWGDRNPTPYGPRAIVQPRFRLGAYITFGVIGGLLLWMGSGVVVTAHDFGVPIILGPFILGLTIWLLLYRPVTAIDPDAKEIVVAYGDPRAVWTRRYAFSQVEHSQTVEVVTNVGTYYWAAVIVPGKRIFVKQCPTLADATVETEKLRALIGR